MKVHGAFGKRSSHSPLKAVSRVQIPYALPFLFLFNIKENSQKLTKNKWNLNELKTRNIKNFTLL